MRFESFSALRGCLKNSSWLSSNKTFVTYDISQFFQIRHLISNRRRTEFQIGILGDRSGTNRLSGLQIVLDNRFQNLFFSLIQFHPISPSVHPLPPVS